MPAVKGTSRPHLTVYCRGAGGVGTEAKGQRGVGLAIKESILQDVEKGGLAVEYISVRLETVRLHLKGKSNGISFMVGYLPTESHKSVRDK